jgi:hypothetical protein
MHLLANNNVAIQPQHREGILEYFDGRLCSTHTDYIDFIQLPGFCQEPCHSVGPVGVVGHAGLPELRQGIPRAGHLTRPDATPRVPRRQTSPLPNLAP